MEVELFNPLDKRNLGLSIADSVFKQEVYPLKELNPFKGAGVYVIYYNGNFSLYEKISDKNKTSFVQPIYAGKAVPEGARKGGLGLDVWNIVLEGFGNHDPGSGRYNQQRSAWDVIHPGRYWAEKLQEGKSKEEICRQILEFLQ